MSQIIRALTWIAPKAVMARVSALAALDVARSYDAAARGRRATSFKGGGESANTALGPALARLRARSSDMVRNTWIGSRVIDILTAHSVGSGISVVWKDKRVQDLWDDWTQSADITGELDFAGVQMIATRSMFERGDSIVRMVPRALDGGRRIPLALQVLEGDYLDESRDGMIGNAQARLGVQLGPWHERTGYYLHGEHPGDNMIASQLAAAGASAPYTSQLIARSDVCHLYRPLRAGQIRGVPVLAPTMMSARDYADLVDAMIVKARLEACHGLIVSRAGGGSTLADGLTRKDEKDRTVETFSPGMVFRGEPGDTITSISPSGSGQFEPVSLSALMGIAVGSMVTYEQLTGDHRYSNYSTMKGGERVLRRLIEQLQWISIVPMLMQRITARWLDVAIMSGAVRDRKSPYLREYVMPAIEPIDPLKDMQADVMAVRSGRMTWAQFCASWGVDPDKQLADIAEWLDKLDAARDGKGVALDVDPRRPSVSPKSIGKGKPSGKEGNDDDQD